MAGEVEATVGHLADDARSRLDEFAGQASETAKDAYRQVRDQVRGVATSAATSVERQPLIALAAVGAACSKPEPMVGEMILVAADVSAEADNDDFGQLLKRDAPCTRRITVYASDNDVALMASRSAHGGVHRAGQMPLANMQYRSPRVELIDASLAPSDLSGHAYFIFSYEMLTDIMWTLDGASMAERAAKGGLVCADWSGGACALGAGRYILKVAPDRQPDFGRRLLGQVAPILLPLQ
jgi:uncharacterized protein YjbJ (UPF0337 family)